MQYRLVIHIYAMDINGAMISRLSYILRLLYLCFAINKPATQIYLQYRITAPHWHHYKHIHAHDTCTQTYTQLPGVSGHRWAAVISTFSDYMSESAPTSSPRVLKLPGCGRCVEAALHLTGNPEPQP